MRKSGGVNFKHSLQILSRSFSIFKIFLVNCELHFLSSHDEKYKKSFKFKKSLLSNIPSENCENLEFNVGVRYLLTLLYIYIQLNDYTNPSIYIYIQLNDYTKPET